MGGTAEVAGVWAEAERPDITLACGDCRARLSGPIGLADVKTIPFGSLCKLHPYYFPHVTPMLATNALALPWEDVAALVTGRARHVDRDAPTEAPWGPLYAPQPLRSPLGTLPWDLERPRAVDPASLSKAHDEMIADLEASRRRADGAVGPVTRIAADLLCAWSQGKPETLNPPEQSVAAAVDYARRLVAMTGGE